jgi:hypothetical protein
MIRCREIGTADLDAIADLLTRGFARRSRDYWTTGLQRQSVRDVPEGFPRFGYMLDHEGTPVGVLGQREAWHTKLLCPVGLDASARMPSQDSCG